MADPLKLCKDCKHASPFVQFIFIKDYLSARCKKSHTEIQLTDGTRTRHEFCSVMRLKHQTECGTAGKLWEPK